MNINIFIALAAGVVSFLSPCIFPVIPSYLTYIGGVSAVEIQTDGLKRRRMIFNSFLFTAGFTLVFTLLGIFFSGVGMALSGVSRYINLAAGAIVILLGLNFLFDFWKLLNFEKRFHFQRRPSGAVGSILLGMAFGAGWTPCIGPILAAILFLAGGSGSVARGALLLLVYSFGLGLPFIAAGIFIGHFQKLFTRIAKHLQIVKVFSGIFLIGVGVLIVTGRLDRINIALFQAAYRYEAFAAASPAAAAAIGSILFFLPAAVSFTVFAGRVRLWGRVRRDESRPGQDGGREASQRAAEDAVSRDLEPRSTRKGSGDEFPYPSFPFVSLAVGSVFAVLFLLALTGFLDVSGFLVSWLTFQGI